MLIFKKVADIQQYLDRKRAAGKVIGFAPTMGALHDGHLQLVRMSRQNGDVSVASIFVNPTQFNDPKDLEKYPRTPDIDAAMLISAGCDVLFMPPVEEVYPPGQDLTLRIDFGPLAEVMEGAFRPGHFGGMATVVHRLLDIVQPKRLYMGQKDFQQLTIVSDMIRQLSLPVELIMCPTLREPDGLAMSSRNVRLSTEMRSTAPIIHQTLQWIKSELPHQTATNLTQEAMQRLVAAGLRPEYVSIVDGTTLQPVTNWDDSAFIVVCTAAFAGEVRLIDNLIVKNG
jgi:pantoate--beta-alanine ligase